MFTSTFGLPKSELADKIVSVFTRVQAEQMDRYKEIIYTAISTALDDPTICVDWQTLDNATTRDADSYEFVIPFDFSIIPEKQQEFILGGIPKHFTDKNETYTVSIGFLKNTGKISISIKCN